MLQNLMTAANRSLDHLNRIAPASRIVATGQTVAIIGVILPLLLIGILKFTAVEVEALKPLISGTPWLAWLYPVFGENGASALLGVVELLTVALFVISPWVPKAGVVGGALGMATFAVTISTMLVLPIWEAESGGFPFLNFMGAFLIKDVALLGVSMVVLGNGLMRLRDFRRTVALHY